MSTDSRRYARGHVLAAGAPAIDAVRDAAARRGWDVAVETLTGAPAGDGPGPVEGTRFVDPVRIRLLSREAPGEPDAGEIVRALARRADVWLDDGRALAG